LREKPFQRTKAIATKDSILQNTNNLAHSTTKYYKIKKGDNLGSISETYGVAIADIKKWNHLKSNALTYGKSLRIVIDEKDNKTMKANSKLSKIVSDRMNETQIASNDTKNNAVVKGDTLSSKGSDFYVVQKGDNLASISKKFGTSVADLKQWNNLNDANIALGSNLVIAKNEIATNLVSVDSFKKKDNMATSQKVEADYYVKKGDSLYSISKKYPGVTISDLKKWNDINGEDLKPGMKLKING